MKEYPRTQRQGLLVSNLDQHVTRSHVHYKRPIKKKKKDASDAPSSNQPHKLERTCKYTHSMQMYSQVNNKN